MDQIKSNNTSQKALTKQDSYIFHSPTFQLVLENAFLSLRRPYVPIEAKQTLLQFVEFILRMAVELELGSRCDLLYLQRDLKSAKTFITKVQRIVMKRYYIQFKCLWEPKSQPPSTASSSSSSTTTTPTSGSLLPSLSSSGNSSPSVDEMIEQLSLEEKQDEKTECFFGLVYRTTVHPVLINALEATNIHKWYPEPEASH